MRDNAFSNFVRSFMVSIECLSNQTVTFLNGADTMVGRKHGDDICAVNMRLLFRMASRESFMKALEYFISDAFITDAYDEEEVGIKLLPLASVVSSIAAYAA